MSQPTSNRKNSVWMPVALVFIVLTVVLGSLSAYLYTQNASLKEQVTSLNTPIKVSLGLGNYTNKEIKWYNMSVREGYNLYQAMVEAGWKVNYTNYGIEGYFITGINGLSNNNTANIYWTYWVYVGGTQNCWSEGPSAANTYYLLPNETVVWYYSPFNGTTSAPPPC
ncbi:MAG: DUF4430 domain-containing protein [Thermoprotei archaeon]